MTSASVSIPSGRVETLDSTQELILKRVWANFLLHWGYKLDAKDLLTEQQQQQQQQQQQHFNAHNSNESSNNSGGSGLGIKKALFGMKKSSSSSNDSPSTKTRSNSLEVVYPKSYIHEALQKLDPVEVKTGFWEFLRTDYPDNLLLRFIRARKWDLDKTMNMITTTIHWRMNEAHPDKVIQRGEKEAFVNNRLPGLQKNLELRKAIIRGRDLKERPIVFVRPRLHHSSQQTESEMEQFALIIIEGTRLFLKEPLVDQATIMFDMTGFGTSNMDYAPVKFLIKCFEAHYPECLGKLIIHKAPWVFSPIWNIVKNWLDPVVASKVVFTKSLKDLEKFINVQNIPECLGGEDEFDLDHFPITDIQEWEKYDSKLKDTQTRDKLLAERKQIAEEFIQTTINWIEAKDKEISQKFLQEKIKQSKLLTENYIALDPYVRSRSQFDIDGTIKL